MEIQLVLPSKEYQQSFMSAVKEFSADPCMEHPDETSMPGEMEFNAYLERIERFRIGKGLPAGYVAETHYWVMRGEEYLGRISLRHELTEKLKVFGGHVGYTIRPSERRKGYAATALKLLLPYAKALGMSELLITCDDTNLGSIKTIEKNGGVYQGKSLVEGRQVETRRYIISL